MDFIGALREFIAEYFINPITYYEGYNPVNTLAYAAIMFIAAFFIIFPYFDKKGVRFNLRFMLALFPYIFLATGIRIFEDLHILERAALPWEAGFYLVTPGIWLAVALLVITCLIISIAVSRRTGKDVYSVFGIIGLLLWLPVLVLDLLLFTRWMAFLYVAAGTAIITGLAYLVFSGIRKIPKLRNIPHLLKNRLNLIAVASQSLDGTATAIAVSFYGYGEQHFVSSFVLGIHPALFIAVKVLLTLAILYYAEKEIKNENLRNFVKVVLIILGSATGSRDILTLAAGSNIM
jgi:uncharacterized membrane protein